MRYLAQPKAGALAIAKGFERYQKQFRDITRRARRRFENRDWHGAHYDMQERLKIRPKVLQDVVKELREKFGANSNDKAIWTRMKALYSQIVARRHDLELAETFYNSITRQIFATVGVDPDIEFLATKFIQPATDGTSLDHVAITFRHKGSSASLVAEILDHFKFDVPYENRELDARIAGAAMDGYVLATGDGYAINSIDIITSVFYRGQGAYLVGRMHRGPGWSPLILALLNEENGIHIDAVLLRQRDASILFSFTRSYFHVDMDRPANFVAFIKSILPQKRLSELYISVGYNKHGKTLLYREILDDLEHTKDLFFPAKGDRGMVMVVFTLPSLDVVFKVIRDAFPPPKTITHQGVIDKYQLVFQQDRAGRLVDAQEFEHLSFSCGRFDSDLLAELQKECSETIRVEGDKIHFSHLYIERRVVPLNLFLRESDEHAARIAVIDYGQSIRDMAATNTFPGDLLLKNFGVTRSGRVIFYDYDELCLLTDCHFREMPVAVTDEQEIAAEPWFYVAENDIFPEEFLKFLSLSESQQQIFLTMHGELLTPDFWRAIQKRIGAGEIIDIMPYDADLRLWRS